MSPFLLTTLSAITLLSLSVAVAMIAKRFRFPYTVALVGTGMILAYVARFQVFAFVDDFQLTPGVLLYIFLPILLFEAAYNIGYKDFFRNVKSISALAVISLLVSAVFIGFWLSWGLSFVGIEVPLAVTFLFWALISATDPVAVLALFKELGAPKRLTLIFEGESLFNDGTALALFLVALWIVTNMSGNSSSEHSNILAHAMQVWSFPFWADGTLSFISMVIGGIGFWALVGFIFSQLIGRLRNEEFLELALTLSLAHTTFIGAEIINHFIFPVSGVIATAIAAMVLGNYGRYKISARVEKTMGHYWEFFAFLSNSLVFMLVGIMVAELHIDWLSLAWPISIAVFIVMAGRAISVYSVVGVLNHTQWEEYIPLSWQHLLSWGSLRGALAVIMVLLIPENLIVPGWNLDMTIRDFVLALTVGCITFTTFVKATTIFPIMRHFWLVNLDDDEATEMIKGELRMLLDVSSKLEHMEKAGRIPKDELAILHTQHKEEINDIEKRLKKLIAKRPDHGISIIRQTVLKHALWLERFWLKELFAYGEISERTFKKFMRKIENQSYRVANGLPQLRAKGELSSTIWAERVSDTLGRLLPHDVRPEYVREYLKVRARNIIATRVLRDLEDIERIGFLTKSGVIAEVRETYLGFESKANTERIALFEKYRKELLPIDSHLANKSLAQAKMRVLQELVDKGTLSQKIANTLKERIDEELFR